MSEKSEALRCSMTAERTSIDLSMATDADEAAWLEYQAVRGEEDAEAEEQLLWLYIESRYGGYDDDGSRTCYNALTNDPQEWK